MRTDEGDVPDMGARKTAGLLRAPLLHAGMIALRETDRPVDVNSTLEELQDDDTYERSAGKALLTMAPAKFAVCGSVLAHERA
jgi:hypothetical protein